MRKLFILLPYSIYIFSCIGKDRAKEIKQNETRKKAQDIFSNVMNKIKAKGLSLDTSKGNVHFSDYLQRDPDSALIIAKAFDSVMSIRLESSDNMVQSENEEQQQDTDIKEKSLNLKRLFEDYKENEVAADRKYKGNEYIVSGKVQKVETFFGSIRIMCIDKTNEYYSYLWTNNEDFAASLKTGQTITVKGTCDGIGTGLSLNYYAVEMKDCTPY